NSSIGEEALFALAASGTREVVDTMLHSPRVQTGLTILNALASNPNVTPSEAGELHRRLQVAGFETGGADTESGQSHSAPESIEGQNEESDEVLDAYLLEHESEIAAEGEKPFQPIGGIYEQEILESEPIEVGSTDTRKVEIPSTESAPVGKVETPDSAP